MPTNTNTSRKANYRKLDTGEWGVFVQGKIDDLKPGSSVVVTKRDGSKQTETIKDIWWRGKGGDVLICRIEQQKFVREEDEDE